MMEGESKVMEYKIIKNLQNDFLVLAILEFIIALLSVLFLKSDSFKNKEN